MRLLIGTFAAALALALPAFAETATTEGAAAAPAVDTATMTCAQYMELDATGQHSALEALHKARTGETSAASEAFAADAAVTTAMTTECERDPATLAMDAYIRAEEHSAGNTSG